MPSIGGDTCRGGLGLFVRWAPRIVAVALAASGCKLPYIPPFTSPGPAAVADLSDSSGRLIGKATLIQHKKGVRILIDFTGTPAGTKAVHIHEVGRCDAPSFESAGGHFNPENKAHGASNPSGPHAGDLPNVVIDENGRGHFETTAVRVSLEKGPGLLYGRNGTAIVLHERADDMRTDPEGDSGARIACGVIEKAG